MRVWLALLVLTVVAAPMASGQGPEPDCIDSRPDAFFEHELPGSWLVPGAVRYWSEGASGPSVAHHFFIVESSEPGDGPQYYEGTHVIVHCTSDDLIP